MRVGVAASGAALCLLISLAFAVAGQAAGEAGPVPHAANGQSPGSIDLAIYSKQRASCNLYFVCLRATVHPREQRRQQVMLDPRRDGVVDGERGQLDLGWPGEESERVLVTANMVNSHGLTQVVDARRHARHGGGRYRHAGFVVVVPRVYACLEPGESWPSGVLGREGCRRPHDDFGHNPIDSPADAALECRRRDGRDPSMRVHTACASCEPDIGERDFQYAA